MKAIHLTRFITDGNNGFKRLRVEATLADDPSVMLASVGIHIQPADNEDPEKFFLALLGPVYHQACAALKPSAPVAGSQATQPPKSERKSRVETQQQPPVSPPPPAPTNTRAATPPAATASAPETKTDNKSAASADSSTAEDSRAADPLRQPAVRRNR